MTFAIKSVFRVATNGRHDTTGRSDYATRADAEIAIDDIMEFRSGSVSVMSRTFEVVEVKVQS